MIDTHKSRTPAPLGRAAFGARFRASYVDPAFRAEDKSITRLEEIAWHAYINGRKVPFTTRRGTRNTGSAPHADAYPAGLLSAQVHSMGVSSDTCL